MNQAIIAAFAPWLALPLMAVVFVAACVALLARSLFVACLCLLAAGAAGCAGLLLLGAGQAGVELALLSVAWTPLLLLAAMVLSKRAAKARARRPWFSLALGGCAAGTLAWATLADAPAAAPAIALGHSAAALWLAPVFLAAAAAVIALAGFGERGALEPMQGRR